MQDDKVSEMIMENLSYKIENEKVVFKFILNTISYCSTSQLVSQKLIDYVMESANSFKRVVSEINEGNENLYLEQILIYNEDNHLLVAFDVAKGKKFNDSEKEILLSEIKESIVNQIEFTKLTLFEMRVNDLEHVVIEINEYPRIYNYQIFQNKYTRS